jgi:hypothetical protein
VQKEAMGKSKQLAVMRGDKPERFARSLLQAIP